MASSHALVSPEGVLHMAPSEARPKKAFCDAHGLRPAYLNLHIAGDKRYKETHGGWCVLDRVKWLQQLSSGKIVVAVGLPKQFYDVREDLCERAGLERSAMPFTLRQFERLLDPDDSSVEELDGWRVVPQLELVRDIKPTGTCTKCLCATVDLYQLLSPKEPDELTRLRQQLAVLRGVCARVCAARGHA